MVHLVVPSRHSDATTVGAETPPWYLPANDVLFLSR